MTGDSDEPRNQYTVFSMRFPRSGIPSPVTAPTELRFAR